MSLEPFAPPEKHERSSRFSLSLTLFPRRGGTSAASPKHRWAWPRPGVSASITHYARAMNVHAQADRDACGRSSRLRSFLPSHFRIQISDLRFGERSTRRPTARRSGNPLVDSVDRVTPLRRHAGERDRPDSRPSESGQGEVEQSAGSCPVSRSKRNGWLPMNRQVGRALRSAPAMRTTSPWAERVCENIWRNRFGGGRRSARPT